MDDTANERLKKARRAAGYSSAKAASVALGVPLATYTQHENGRRNIPRDAAPLYARRFKVTEEWLLYGKGGREAPTPTVLAMPVQLPNVDALTDMFVSLLEQVQVDPHQDERAEKLARSFPGVLQGALLRQAGLDAESGNTRAGQLRADDADRPSPRR